MKKKAELPLEDVPCNLCGSRARRTLYNRPYALDSLTEGGACVATTDIFDKYGRIVRCSECGLVYTNPRPRRELLQAGYGSCVDEEYLAEGSSRSINAHLSLNTIKRFAHSGRMIEIGASVGYFLNAARVDFDVLGLELSEWASRIARERFKLDVRAQTLEQAGHLEAGSFDVAVMIDVIEHLADPVDALKRAARLLKPGGILYLVTPDIDSLSARFLGRNWWALRPAHIYYFDRATLRRALSKAGMEVVYEGSFGRIFTLGYWASRLGNYPKVLSGSILRLIRFFDAESKFMYLNTRDSVEMCARKK